MDGVVEIITGRERRRHWSDEAKLRIVAETYKRAPGCARSPSATAFARAWCSPDGGRCVTGC